MAPYKQQPLAIQSSSKEGLTQSRLTPTCFTLEIMKGSTIMISSFTNIFTGEAFKNDPNEVFLGVMMVSTVQFRSARERERMCTAFKNESKKDLKHQKYKS